MEKLLLARAVELALENVRARSGGPFGAVITRAGAVIAEGINRVTLDCDPTAHAEIVAIREAARRLNSFELRKCVIYSSCEPCPMCLAAIYWARMEAIYFAASRDEAAEAGFDDRFLYAEIPKALGDRQILIERVQIPEALQPFEAWNQDHGKIHY